MSWTRRGGSLSPTRSPRRWQTCPAPHPTTSPLMSPLPPISTAGECSHYVDPCRAVTSTWHAFILLITGNTTPSGSPLELEHLEHLEHSCTHSALATLATLLANPCSLKGAHPLSVNVFTPLTSWHRSPPSNRSNDGNHRARLTYDDRRALERSSSCGNRIACRDLERSREPSNTRCNDRFVTHFTKSAPSCHDPGDNSHLRGWRHAGRVYVHSADG